MISGNRYLTICDICSEMFRGNRFPMITVSSEMASVELLKLVDPSLYYSKFIEGGVFPDGRAIDSFKAFSFKVRPVTLLIRRI